ncbi:hypothetical protein ACIRQQ_14055 [Streptomyces fuscichromogenes]|uniref:hypothetical protein n=1 Tax=Streptomyces fuscichromogenes TaxID=1324013 RepID=UPI00380557EB
MTSFDDNGRNQLITTFIVTALIAPACRLLSRAPSRRLVEAIGTGTIRPPLPMTRPPRTSR